MGLFSYWGPWAAKVPWLATFLRRPSVFGRLRRSRQVTRSNDAFPDSHRKRSPGNSESKQKGGNGEQVLLVPDLYNDCFFPETLSRGRARSSAAGLSRPPARKAHQGSTAAASLRHARPGCPGAAEGDRCPARLCISVHTRSSSSSRARPRSTGTKWRSSFPTTRMRIRIRKQSYLLSEFIEARNLDLPQLPRQGAFPCALPSESGARSGRRRALCSGAWVSKWRNLNQAAAAWPVPSDSKSAHYEVSNAIGQENLLPAVSKASRTTYVVADGFSCRSQIIEGTSRKPLHLAELLYAAFEAVGSAYEADHLKRKPEEKDHEIRKAA